MAIHTNLPIHKRGCDLLALSIRAQANMPRAVRRHLGDKISGHCMEMLDLMALANASQHAQRAGHIQALLMHQRALTVLLRVSHDERYISPKLWASSVQLLDSIGKQGGGWLKSTSNRGPAA